MGDKVEQGWSANIYGYQMLLLDDLTKIVADFLHQRPVFRIDELDEPPSHPRGRKLTQTDRESVRREIWKATHKINQVVRATPGVMGDPWFPYLIASRSFKSSILYHETALRYWLGLPPTKTLHVLTLQNQKQWEYRLPDSEWSFHPVERPSSMTKSEVDLSTLFEVSHLGQTIQITSPERTIIDVLNDSALTVRPINTWRQLCDLLRARKGNIQWQPLLDCLELTGSAVAYARTGLLLECHPDDLDPPEELIKLLRAKRPGTPCRWHRDIPGRKIWDWNLYVPHAVLRETWEFEPPEQACSRDIDESQHDLPDSTTEDQLDEGLLDPQQIPDEPPVPEPWVPLDASGTPREPSISPDLEPDYTNQPGPRESQPDLEVHLRERFDRTSFRNGQEEIIRAVLAGKDAVGVLPTGSGKSLTYQMLTILRGGTTLVVSPLIALMEDQVAEATKPPLGLRAAVINGSMDPNERDEVKRRLQHGELDLLFMSPESLLNIQRFLARNRKRIRLVAVDEAHCISQWGHDFRPAFHDLQHLRSVLGQDVPILALTATATNRVQDAIISYLRMDKPFLKIVPATRSNLKLKCIQQDGSLDTKLPHLNEFLGSRNEQQGVIYCATRKGTEKVARFVSSLGLEARHYHAGVTPEERTRIYQGFKSGEIKVVVATTAFGMGVNIPSVGFVVHLNLPSSIEAYVQEIGRAGRDGSMADCLLIHSPADAAFQRYLARKTHPDNRSIALSHVARMRAFACQDSCRHKTIANYFGDTHTPDCLDLCDVCCRNQGQHNVFHSPQMPRSSPS